MGAAGISCSTTEMSAKGKSGMKIDLSKVPLREDGMTAYEIMLSESQERMLVVVKKGNKNRVKEIFEKWDLHCEIIGEVIDEPMLYIDYNGKREVEIFPHHLVLGGGAPVYHRASKKPSYLKKTKSFKKESLPVIENIEESIYEVLSSPNIVSKRWVYEQYDSMVRTNTVVGPGCDAAVVYIKGTNKALAMKTDCNSRYVYLNPREGAKIAVAESARNIVCSGGVPLGITNCLNFGNPYKPEIYWQFKEAIAGMGEACRAFKTPVTGGNVSFYNESPDAAVYPTPVIGMVGLVEDLGHITTSYFKNEKDLIFVIGDDLEEIGGSEYLKVVHNTVAGDSPQLNLDTEKRLHETISHLIRNKLIQSAHDISEGGIVAALVECSIMNREKMIGAKVIIPIKSRFDFSLFSESQSRVIVSVKKSDRAAFEYYMMKNKLLYRFLGMTGGKLIKINDEITLPLSRLEDIYYNTLSQIMGS